VLNCAGCELLNEVPHPATAITQTKSNVHRALRDPFLEKPRRSNGMGETSARSNGEALNWPLLEALMVIFVLCGALPDSVEGANVQPHPLGRPEHAKDNDALNPFSGATETVKEPGVPCATVSAPLESVSP
jgi:hypothetical protein